MDAMEAIYATVCGLDVHNKTVVACHRRFRAGGPVAQEGTTFATTTSEVLSLLAWLDEWQVSHVAMESTGVEWKPVGHLLEGHGDLLLVKARHLKMMPGRKTDVKDGAWSAQLLQDGLLRASCVPSPAVRQWRDVTRHRATLIEHHPSVVHRGHNTRGDANIKWSSVIRDIMGVSGRRMLHALALGQDDVSALWALGAGRLRATPQELPERGRGKLNEYPCFMLASLLEPVEFLTQQIARLDARLEERMRPVAAQLSRLDSIDGIDARGAQNLLADLGPDMEPLPEAAHRSSWAGRSPGKNESAGNRRRGKTTQGHKWLRRT